ncbi:MAG: hypothetical protein ACOYL6_15390 [Bacteriovoracaceae bacterium]
MKKIIIGLTLLTSISSYASFEDRICGKDVYSTEVHGETVLCAEVFEVKGSSNKEYDGKIGLMNISKSMASNPLMDYLINDDTKVTTKEDLDSVCAYFGQGKYIDGTKAIEKAEVWTLSKDHSYGIKKKIKHIRAVMCEPKL